MEDKRGLRRWLVCPMLAGDSPGRAWGGGILWLNWQRRGDFQAVLRDRLPQEKATASLGWSHINAQSIELHEAAVNLFFETPWLSFDAFIVEGHIAEDVAASDSATKAEAFDERQRRALLNFVHDQIRDRLRAEPDEPQPIRLWLDAAACGFASRKAALYAIEQDVFRPLFQRLRLVDKALNHRTRRTPALQLGGLLLDSVLAAWQSSSVGQPRRQIQGAIAQHLGWDHLRIVSRPGDTKFNIRLGAPQERSHSRVPVQLPLFESRRSSRRPVPLAPP